MGSMIALLVTWDGSRGFRDRCSVSPTRAA
jgi:hypothetical protein